MDKTYPYDDQDMVYDYDMHRYILTPECVFTELGIDLRQDGNVTGSTNPSAYATQLLSRVSRMIYNYIYEAVQNAELWSYRLAKTPSVRAKIKAMMLAQVEYILTSGYTPQMSGINPSTATVTDLNAIRGRAKVADEVEQIASQTVAEWGISMRYSGTIKLICDAKGEW